MKELIQQLAAYNIWANQLLFDVILSLPDEKQKVEVPSSFNSLYKTALHMWSAESVWWQRLTSPGSIVDPGTGFTGTMQELVSGLSRQSHQWKEWTDTVKENDLKEILHYRNIKGEAFSKSVCHVAVHVFNHDTYHRGQLVNMLRQLGVTNIPQTDFSVWARTKK